MELCIKLKTTRNEHKFTQEQIANKLRVSRKTISSWENGRNCPDIYCLIKLSELYNMTLDDLVAK